MREEDWNLPLPPKTKGDDQGLDYLGITGDDEGLDWLG